MIFQNYFEDDHPHRKRLPEAPDEECDCEELYRRAQQAESDFMELVNSIEIATCDELKALVKGEMING